MSELAALLGVHVRTVQSWHKLGMSPIDENDRPLLFLGDTVHSFLSARRESCRHKLAPGEFFCVRCQKARKPTPGTLTFERTGKCMGAADEQVIVRGKCDKCGCGLVRFGTRHSVLSGCLSTLFQEACKGL